MNTITLHKEEVRPEYLKKLDRISASLDKGAGVKFLNTKELKEFLKNL